MDDLWIFVKAIAPINNTPREQLFSEYRMKDLGKTLFHLGNFAKNLALRKKKGK